MVTVKDWLDKFKKVGSKVKVNQLVKEIALRNSAQIIELQQIQLDKGMNRNGIIVGHYKKATQTYAKNSIKKPNQDKMFGQPYNFDWTGSFINGIFIKYKRGVISFHSKGMGDKGKTDFIIATKLLGATEETARIINDEIITPQFIREFKKL